MDIIPNDLKYSLLNYLGGDLRRNHGIRERYFFISFKNNTMFFNVSHGYRDLYNMLVSNPETTARVKQELTTVLSSYLSDINSVGLIFDNTKFGIILERNGFRMMDSHPYVITASNFDTVEELDDFCQSSFEVSDVCKTTEFWRSLLKFIYPETYRGEYTWEFTYKGYLQVKPYLYKDIIVPELTMNPRYISEYLCFLYGEELIPLKYYKKFGMIAVSFGLTSVFEKIYTNISEEDKKSMFDFLEASVQVSIVKNNVPYITNFFRMVPATSINNFNLFYKISVAADSRRLDVNLVEPIIEYFISGDRAQIYEYELTKIIIGNAIKNNNKELIDYIFKRLIPAEEVITGILLNLDYYGVEPTSEIVEYFKRISNGINVYKHQW